MASAKTVTEERYVQIGGIQQWITITGADDRNPVVLFLHGGPGNALSPYAGALYAGWERNFTLVQWDQRGAGAESTMTMERMVADGLEVAELLRRRFKRRIILVGGSWGSVLGIQMVRARPKLFHAYVGVAQVVNWQQNTLASYRRLLELASAEDQQASARTWPVFRKRLKIYQSKVATAPVVSYRVSPAYASPAERRQYEEADDFSFLHFWGPALSGPLTKFDIAALGTKLSVPLFIVQGEKDLTTLPELTREWFDRIDAGHEVSAVQLELTLKLLLQTQHGPA